MNTTVWLTVWRAKEHEVWNEAGAHVTQEQAQAAANALKTTGLQATVWEWRNSPLAVR